jgi:hypothetical protein
MTALATRKETMTTTIASDIPLVVDTPAERLRRIAAAVRVHFTWWGVHRTLTAQQKEEIGLACSADARLLTAGKKLIDTRNEVYRQLTSLRSRVASYWRGLTLPYTEPGIRLIRQADIDGFVHAMEGFREDLHQAEAKLNEVYDQIKADAHRRLGKLYQSGDYPSEIRGLFQLDWDFPAVEPPSYLLRLNPEIYEQEQQRVAARFEEALRLAEQAFIGELARLVSHLTERLTGTEGERKVFRDSAISNLTDFFGRFQELNVRSNAQLDELVEQAKRVVSGVEPQELRDNDGLRRHVATQLSQVQSVLDGMMVDQPRRRIIRSTPSANGANHATPH